LSFSTILLITLCLLNLLAKELAIKLIGLYSLILVTSNAVVVILLLPPMVIFNEKYLEQRTFCFK